MLIYKYIKEVVTMYYREYLQDVRFSLSKVNKALNDGVILSRLERFDYIFKKLLLEQEGKIVLPIKNKLLGIFDKDYAKAKFFAKSLSSIMKTYKKGYTVKGLEEQFKEFSKGFHSLFGVDISVFVEDLNGVITVIMCENFKDIHIMDITGMDSYINTAIGVVSFLGAYKEKDEGYKNWFSNYLEKTVNIIKNNSEVTPFIERFTVRKNLNDYSQRGSSDGNVIPFTKCV